MPNSFKQEGKVIRVLRALYGMPRSPLIWLNKLTSTLKGLGLTPVPGVPCLFTNKYLTVFFYVDDIIILNRLEHASISKQFRSDLMAIYEMHNLGPLS
jgi:hypothetical protein